jgi:hypothetical protein
MFIEILQNEYTRGGFETRPYLKPFVSFVIFVVNKS